MLKPPPGQITTAAPLAMSFAGRYTASWGVETILQIIDEGNLDADEKVYLWTFFDSKQRSAMKKAAEARKQPVTA